VNAATNQLTGNGLGYDANGNMTNPPSGGTLTYDFLNRVVAMTGGVAYSYDASNRRVWKQNSSGQEYYLYGLDGENLGTYTPQLGGSPAQLSFTLASGQERDYFFGKKLFTTEDNVGSAAIASANQAQSYYPYGEQKSGPTPTEQYKFATYWRDSESGLDYASNRYYSSTLGRFLSADPYVNSGGLANPQSWNRYAYVENDPISKGDPGGLCSVTYFSDTNGGGQCQAWWGTASDPAGAGPGIPYSGGQGGDYLSPDPESGSFLGGVGGGGLGPLFGPVTWAGIVGGLFSGLPLPTPSGPAAPNPTALCELEETAYLMTYLGKYNSPLTPYAAAIVSASDAAGIDDRFIVALAGVETTYGTQSKYPIPQMNWGMYNAWNNGHQNYGGWLQALAAVLANLNSPNYINLQSTLAIYSMWEEGGKAVSPMQGTLDQIYGTQLGGNTSDVRFSRCNGGWTGW